jgi:hypothetical protein
MYLHVSLSVWCLSLSLSLSLALSLSLSNPLTQQCIPDVSFELWKAGLCIPPAARSASRVFADIDAGNDLPHCAYESSAIAVRPPRVLLHLENFSHRQPPWWKKNRKLFPPLSVWRQSALWLTYRRVDSGQTFESQSRAPRIYERSHQDVCDCAVQSGKHTILKDCSLDYITLLSSHFKCEEFFCYIHTYIAIWYV